MGIQKIATKRKNNMEKNNSNIQSSEKIKESF